MPGTASASSCAHSIAAGADADWLAMISVPGAATDRAAAAIFAVIAVEAFGLMTWMRIAVEYAAAATAPEAVADVCDNLR